MTNRTHRTIAIGPIGPIGMGRTTIEVDESTRDRLRVWKAERGVTYSEALEELLDRAEEPVDAGAGERAPSGASSDGGERIRCEHCGNVWTTTSEAPRPSCSMCSKKTDRLLP